MARLFDDASSEYLERTTSVPMTIYPFTMACWFNSDSLTVDQNLLQIEDTASGTNYHALYLAGAVAGDLVRARSRAGDGIAVTTAAYTANVWRHACGVFAAKDDRAVYLDGANKGTDATESNDAGIDAVSIGRAGDSSPDRYMSGSIAEAAIWNVALTDAEVAILAGGFSPLFVRPGSLVAYWPLIQEPDTDVVNNYHMTAYNTPTVSAHPPIKYPTRPPAAYNELMVY